MLKVRKDGAVKGGDIYFDYDPTSEKIHYFGHVKVGLGPLVKKFSFNDYYSVSKDMMASASKYAGQKIDAGDCVIEVVSVYPDKGWGTAHFKAEDFEGIANIDISKEFIDIIMINGKVEFQGLDLKVSASRQ
jgi:hypothetical protein